MGSADYTDIADTSYTCFAGISYLSSLLSVNEVSNVQTKTPGWLTGRLGKFFEAS
mgnify:CR=1 FL=1